MQLRLQFVSDCFSCKQTTISSKSAFWASVSLVTTVKLNFIGANFRKISNHLTPSVAVFGHNIKEERFDIKI